MTKHLTLKSSKFRSVLASLALVTALSPVIAPAAQAEEGDWLVRLRAIYVAPDASATTNIGGSATISNSIVPELDITYFITNNIAAELILATARHSPTATGTALGDVPLGAVNLLPPTLTLQYHFAPDADVRPYVGAGINYTVFFNADVPTTAGNIITDVDYSNSFGYAVQAGVDFQVTDGWFLNVDAKKYWLKTDLSINGGAVTGEATINPMIWGVGFGRKF